jgi:hypothetical protein
MSGYGPETGSRPTVKTELTLAHRTQATFRFSGVADAHLRSDPREHAAGTTLGLRTTNRSDAWC